MSPTERLLWVSTVAASIVLALLVVSAPALTRNFPKVMTNVFWHEGGYSNHPRDPGGATNYGITIHDVRRYIKRDATPADVRALTMDQARAIYKPRYWDTVRGDDMPPGLDYTLMDYGVHSGPARARQVLRRVMGVEATQAKFSDADIKLIRKKCEPDNCASLILGVNQERHQFLRRLRIWSTFGIGWNRRVNFVIFASLMMNGTVRRADSSAFMVPMRTYGRGIDTMDEWHD